MFPWWPFTKIVQAVMVCQKTWPLDGRVLFSLYIYICIETFNDLLVRNHWTYFKITLQECFLCNPLSRLFKQSWFIKKTWPLYIYIENFKNYLVRNHWTDFKYNLAEMFLWWPPTKIIQVIAIHQKTWLPQGGAYFPYIIYIENLKNLLVRNQWTDFSITWQECFFGDPLPRLFKPSWLVKKHGR